MAHCNDCGLDWTGHSVCHCSGCCETFTSLSGFDAHQTRVGGRLRCLPPGEVTRKDGVTPVLERKAKGRWGLVGSWAPEPSVATGLPIAPPAVAIVESPRFTG